MLNPSSKPLQPSVDAVVHLVRLLAELNSGLLICFYDRTDIMAHFFAKGQKLGLPANVQINRVDPLMADGVIGHSLDVDIALVQNLKQRLGNARPPCAKRGASQL